MRHPLPHRHEHRSQRRHRRNLRSGLRRGCTDGDAQCAEIEGELGFGPSNLAAASDPDAFTWNAASYNSGHTEDDNDEHSATITTDTEGNYAYAYRFRVGAEGDWVYCDTDGTDNGFQTESQGQLTVGTPASSVEWCQIQYPASTTSVASVLTESIFGQAFVSDCTGDENGPCAELSAEVGFGEVGVDPSTTPESYTWTGATLNAEHSGDDNDEFAAKINPQPTAPLPYAMRFSLDDGSNWTYCDTDGGTAYSTDELGSLTVADKVIGWCNTQYPTAITVSAGTATEAIYGQVYVEGCTDGARLLRRPAH